MMNENLNTRTDLSEGTSRLRPVIARPPRILLAEDDYEMRTLIHREFQRSGFDVIECRDGYQLLAQLGTPPLAAKPEAVDIIVSDIRMPGVTGLEILEALHETEWNLPMVLITAFGDENTHALAFQYGAAAMFDKPFEIGLLIDRVRDVLGLNNPAGNNWTIPPAPKSQAGRPVDIVYSHVSHMPEVEAIVAQAYNHLAPYSKEIVYCRVIIEGSRIPQATGEKYHIQLMVTLPDDVLVIRSHQRSLRETGSLNTAIRDAFGAMRGKLRRHFDSRKVD